MAIYTPLTVPHFPPPLAQWRAAEARNTELEDQVEMLRRLLSTKAPTEPSVQTLVDRAANDGRMLSEYSVKVKKGELAYHG